MEGLTKRKKAEEKIGSNHVQLLGGECMSGLRAVVVANSGKTGGGWGRDLSPLGCVLVAMSGTGQSRSALGRSIRMSMGCRMASGSTWYPLSASWFEKFKAYTASDDATAPHPGQIDNSSIQDPKRPLCLKQGIVSIHGLLFCCIESHAGSDPDALGCGSIAT